MVWAQHAVVAGACVSDSINNHFHGTGVFRLVIGGIPSLYQSLAQSWPTLKDL
ncbi:hypothetical protein EMIT0196MI5_20328 [Pseudomonas sp. IT-196MI5]